MKKIRKLFLINLLKMNLLGCVDIDFNNKPNFKVLSNIGIYEYRKIIALKRFLKHFSTFDNRGPEYSKLMEDYVVYASIFNLLNEKIYVGNISSTIENILKK